MEVPLKIAFEGIQHSDAIEARIREEAGKLEQFFERIVSARVVVARPQHRHHKGDIYHIRVHLVVPDAADIVVTREPAATGAHEDVYVTIRDAFKAARRQLQDVVRKRGGHVKEHEVAPHGAIAELHSEADYGIIASSDPLGENWVKTFSGLATKAGITLTGTEYFQRADTSTTAQCLNTVAENPDAVAAKRRFPRTLRSQGTLPRYDGTRADNCHHASGTGFARRCSVGRAGFG